MTQQTELNFGSAPEIGSPQATPQASTTASTKAPTRSRSRAGSRKSFRRGGWQGAGENLQQLSLDDVSARVKQVIAETAPEPVPAKVAAVPTEVAQAAAAPVIPWPTLEERAAEQAAATAVLTAPLEASADAMTGDRWFWVALGGLLVMAWFGV
ncbi:MAG: hypothetical protein AAF581_05375 [Planctomycetota bacterium]